MKQKSPRNIWITGASRGLGACVAQNLAGRGNKVFITARNLIRLNEVAAQSPKPGTVIPMAGDVTDLSQMKVIAQNIENDHGPLDIIISSAGEFLPVPEKIFDAADFGRMLQINVQGTTNMFSAALPFFLERKRGHAVFVSSLAGYRGLPNYTFYSPTKAAIISLAQSLKFHGDIEGLKIQLVTPGFIDTDMGRKNNFYMPFLMSAEEAADKLVRGLDRNSFEISFPFSLSLLVKLSAFLPDKLYFHIISKGMKWLQRIGPQV